MTDTNVVIAVFFSVISYTTLYIRIIVNKKTDPSFSRGVLLLYDIRPGRKKELRS